MFKKTVAIVTMALLAVPAVGQAANRQQFRWDLSEPTCVPLNVSTGAKDVHVGSNNVHVPGLSNLKVCLTSDTKVTGTPTATAYDNCGTTCFAVRVADINASANLKVELTYKEDDVNKSVSIDPDSIDVGRDLEEVCVSSHDAGTPDPCVITLTSPSDLQAKGGFRQTSLRWTPGGEAYGRRVETTYEVWRSTGTELEAFELISEGLTETSFIDSGLTRRTTYNYFVVAVDGEGNRSGGSNLAQATTT